MPPDVLPRNGDANQNQPLFGPLTLALPGLFEDTTDLQAGHSVPRAREVATQNVSVTGGIEFVKNTFKLPDATEGDNSF